MPIPKIFFSILDYNKNIIAPTNKYIGNNQKDIYIWLIASKV